MVARFLQGEDECHSSLPWRVFDLFPSYCPVRKALYHPGPQFGSLAIMTRPLQPLLAPCTACSAAMASEVGVADAGAYPHRDWGFGTMNTELCGISATRRPPHASSLTHIRLTFQQAQACSYTRRMLDPAVQMQPATLQL